MTNDQTNPKSKIQNPKSKPGRPKGSTNRDVDQVAAPVTACAKCGSTARTPYFNRRDLDYAGTCLITGQVYTRIVVRRTQCAACGQFRDDRQLVNEPAGDAA